MPADVAGGFRRSLNRRKMLLTPGRRTPPLERREFVSLGLSGGIEGIRTLYLLHAVQALSQLSYNPVDPEGVEPSIT